MTFCSKVLSCFACCLLVGTIVGCGKSEEKKDAAKSLTEIAKAALDPVSPEMEVSHVQTMLQEAGYVMKSYTDFPAEELGKKARVLIYTDKGGKSGGIIYLRKTGAMIAPAWHWYFGDMVPETVTKVELNDDGLWDVRVVSKGGKQVEFLQDQSFIFTGADRSDWIALNGAASTPMADGDALWKCFDSDTSTAWRSSLGTNGGVFVELSAPFGIKDGILGIQALSVEQPRQCTLYADGKKIQTFELSSVATEQEVRLDDGVKGARAVRVTFDTVHGAGNVVSVAELSLR
jgi:hypothetical protein